ncbi:unnamed protein product [Moneuplotes crassus]|uniref:Uncharacterized protein n=1 Tax=Euplotes crassus TaxID=5936 RepID=A0AAD1UMR0_EUPCR|nr:unnamed protein product [Moneuplotes crassus]
MWESYAYTNLLDFHNYAFRLFHYEQNSVLLTKIFEVLATVSFIEVNILENMLIVIFSAKIFTACHPRKLVT